ncbi:MAG: dipeptidase [Chitinophagaceae bacterium]|nr:dipeptidase [Chitinophagaceae bacterium]
MSKKIFFLFLVSAYFNVFAQNSNRLHQIAVVADAHNDVLYNSIMPGQNISYRLSTGHSDLYRFPEGGIDVQIFSVWCGPEYGRGKAFSYANQMIDSLYAVAQRNPDKLEIVKSYAQLKKGLKQKKLVGLIGVEGGHMIEDSMEYLDSLHKRGMAYMTLTWNNSTSWATSALDEASPQPPPKEGEQNSAPKKKGLTDFGKQIVRRMNELGIMLDLAHVGPQTFFDAIAITSKPVIVSHSNSYVLTPFFRNITDEQILAVKKNGGVICINFIAQFVDSSYQGKFNALLKQHQKLVDSVKAIYSTEVIANEKIAELLMPYINEIRPPLSKLMDHIDYVANLAGADHVGLGSDFDGGTAFPLGMEDVTKFPVITEELKKRGYSNKDIRKILGENILRVYKANVGR